MEAIHLDQYFLRHQTFHPLNSTFLIVQMIHIGDLFTVNWKWWWIRRCFIPVDWWWRGRLVRTVSPIFNTVWPFAILIVQVICWRIQGVWVMVFNATLNNISVILKNTRNIICSPMGTGICICLGMILIIWSRGKLNISFLLKFWLLRRSFPRNLAENSEAASFLGQTTSY
jgi:hypothetical protein